jgi:hypothetical protein
VIDGKDRPGVARGNDYFVPVRKGEIYMIKIENRTPQMAMMRVLVDGLNTLPERSAKGIVTTQWGQHVNLDEARPWELDPNSAKGIRGFTTEVGTQGKYKEFVVTDAEQSLAARRQFTDQMGIITVAFYAPKGGTRQLGTAAGREVDQKYESSRGMQCGNLLGVVHLRYVEAEALRMAGR